MPLYEYLCDKCGLKFELIEKFSDVPKTVHEGCGGAVHRLISAPSFQFKGSGFYITDYGKGTSKVDSSKSDSKKSGDGKSSSDSKSSDSKSSDSKPSESKSSSSDSSSSSTPASTPSSPSSSDSGSKS
jgi:putative FmdB family regulatory protein